MFTSEQIIAGVRWLENFRTRIIFILLIPVVLAIGVYWKADLMIGLITRPLHGLPLYFATPVEGFMVKVKLAMFMGCILALPIVGYLIISLFSHRMQVKTKRITYYLVIPFATVSFIGGLVFGYQLIIPATFTFLLNCGNEFMKPMLIGSNYVSFIMFLLISIGIVFELPLILVVLSRIGIVSSRVLRDKRKVAIMIILIVLAIITPTPDAFTLALISLPMIILYEISIWWIFFLEKGDLH